MPTENCEFTKYAQRILKNKSWYPWHFERAVGGVIMTGAAMPLTRTGRLNMKNATGRRNAK